MENKNSIKKTLCTIGLSAATLLAVQVIKAQEPDFSKLPNTYYIERQAVAINDNGVERIRKGMYYGTAFKIGEFKGMNYYATANHINSAPLPKPIVDTDKVHDEWFINNTRLFVEKTDSYNDTMILSTRVDLGDEPIKECVKQPMIGDNTYVFGYHRGILGLGEGRIGGLESKISGDDKSYYFTDADVLPGASGSPHLLYQDNDFCVFGMVLANIDGGFFSASSDIKHTIKLYEEVIE